MPGITVTGLRSINPCGEPSDKPIGDAARMAANAMIYRYILSVALLS